MFGCVPFNVVKLMHYKPRSGMYFDLLVDNLLGSPRPPELFHSILYARESHPSYCWLHTLVSKYDLTTQRTIKYQVRIVPFLQLLVTIFL